MEGGGGTDGEGGHGGKGNKRGMEMERGGGDGDREGEEWGRLWILSRSGDGKYRDKGGGDRTWVGM